MIASNQNFPHSKYTGEGEVVGFFRYAPASGGFRDWCMTVAADNLIDGGKIPSKNRPAKPCAPVRQQNTSFESNQPRSICLGLSVVQGPSWGEFLSLSPTLDGLTVMSVYEMDDTMHKIILIRRLQNISRLKPSFLCPWQKRQTAALTSADTTHFVAIQEVLLSKSTASQSAMVYNIKIYGDC